MNRELQVFSGSSVQTFMRCQRQWEFAYVYELKRPPSVRMILGTAAHAAEEVNFKQKLVTKEDIPLEAALDVFSDAFDSAVIEAEPDPEDKESPGQAKDSGIATLSVYHETVAPPIEPLFVEHEGLVHVNDIPYSYTIDLVDTKGRVRDHKYTKRRPQSSADYRLSMIGYALGYREETGKKEADVVLDYMVRTKDPYHWPVASSGPVPDAAINSFANILELVNAAVMEGRFLPTGLTNHACSWCGYNDICPDYTSM
jgi:CRISPR/Cas system-associated exonuclease Cas4 (RecB family)